MEVFYNCAEGKVVRGVAALRLIFIPAAYSMSVMLRKQSGIANITVQQVWGNGGSFPNYLMESFVIYTKLTN